MAWVYNQYFNALVDGDLNGQDSWAATGASTDFLVSTAATTRYEGAKGLSLPTTSAGNYRRAVTGTTTGTVWYAMKYTTASATGDGVNFNLKTGAAFGAITKFVQVAGTNKLQYFSGGTGYLDLVSPAVTDTWYVIQMVYDCTSGGDGSYSVGVNGGALVTGIPMAANVSAGIDTIEIGNDGTSGWDCQFDTISSTDINVASSIKTFDGLARASVKTIDGLAIANVKTVNGLA